MSDAITHDTDGVYDAYRSTDRLREAFTSGELPVSVYGLGKMGLPLAAVFADVTGNVRGVDIDPTVVDAINDGTCHVKREPGLPSLVERTVANEALGATTDPRDAAREGTIHVIIVPTPITDDNEPDLSILDTVVEDIGRGLEAGDLVLVECTVPPRTTIDRIVPRLEGSSDLTRGEFGVAVCPERTSSGRALEDIRGAYPKVVGGIDEETTRVAAAIYDTINDTGVIPVADATTAEAVKVFEGVYRDVNIALANELATFTDELGIDVREAIDVANTQPYCDIHDPGPGVGGHCIPFYPYFLIDPFETDAPLLETARGVNDSMPGFTVEKLREGLEVIGRTLTDATVLVLGLTYRPGVEEIQASPSLTIAERLSQAGSEVYGVDPMLESAEEFALELITLEDSYERTFDGVILVTPHEEFETIRWSTLASDDRTVVIDGRDSIESAVLESAAQRVYTIGGGHNV
ncbi:nucleotide sugar dehydrogenase [Halobacteria archaeon AArc-curdl1]|uniref:UDP-N-acetyl-D-mannosamine dehydrogenase n=1 Tax=Natronosalvus hydrolyticus TaxID=2979988 RepID=A0AAP2ZD64_9EURY|nr:nucleotide sugar dehydrogenase [Halobacteria archaeon AArc-curdl1]